MPRPIDREKWRLWAERVCRFEQSGLPGAEWCRREGLPLHPGPGERRSVASGTAHKAGANHGHDGAWPSIATRALRLAPLEGRAPSRPGRRTRWSGNTPRFRNVHPPPPATRPPLPSLTSHSSLPRCDSCLRCRRPLCCLDCLWCGCCRLCRLCHACERMCDLPGTGAIGAMGVSYRGGPRGGCGSSVLRCGRDLCNRPVGSPWPQRQRFQAMVEHGRVAKAYIQHGPLARYAFTPCARHVSVLMPGGARRRCLVVPFAGVRTCRPSPRGVPGVGGAWCVWRPVNVRPAPS